VFDSSIRQGRGHELTVVLLQPGAFSDVPERGPPMLNIAIPAVDISKKRNTSWQLLADGPHLEASDCFVLSFATM